MTYFSNKTSHSHIFHLNSLQSPPIKNWMEPKQYIIAVFQVITKEKGRATNKFMKNKPKEKTQLSKHNVNTQIEIQRRSIIKMYLKNQPNNRSSGLQIRGWLQTLLHKHLVSLAQIERKSPPSRSRFLESRHCELLMINTKTVFG